MFTASHFFSYSFSLDNLDVSFQDYQPHNNNNNKKRQESQKNEQRLRVLCVCVQYVLYDLFAPSHFENTKLQMNNYEKMLLLLFGFVSLVFSRAYKMQGIIPGDFRRFCRRIFRSQPKSSKLMNIYKQMRFFPLCFWLVWIFRKVSRWFSCHTDARTHTRIVCVRAVYPATRQVNIRSETFRFFNMPPPLPLPPPPLLLLLFILTYWFISILFWLIIIFCHHKIKWIKEFTAAATNTNNNNDDGGTAAADDNQRNALVEQMYTFALVDETLSPVLATVSNEYIHSNCAYTHSIYLKRRNNSIE